MKRLALILLGLFLVVPNSQTRAAPSSGFAFKPSFIYYFNKEDRNQTTGTTYTWIDFTLGYKFDQPLYIGATYHMPSMTVHGGSSDCTYNQNGYGPTVGFLGSSAYVLGTYFISNQLSGCGTTIRGGTHWQVDAGYRYSVTGNVDIAPQITYYNFEFTEADSGSSLNPKHKYFGLIPMISLWVYF